MPQFGERGERLWAQLGISEEFSPAGVLAVEACRMADRLESLDEDPFSAQEARLTAGALKALLESPMLKQQSAAKEASAIDALAARRAARRSAASGS
jgi:hypothetical protein